MITDRRTGPPTRRCTWTPPCSPPTCTAPSRSQATRRSSTRRSTPCSAPEGIAIPDNLKRPNASDMRALRDKVAEVYSGDKPLSQGRRESTDTTLDDLLFEPGDTPGVVSGERNLIDPDDPRNPAPGSRTARNPSRLQGPVAVDEDNRIRISDVPIASAVPVELRPAGRRPGPQPDPLVGVRPGHRDRQDSRH